MAAVLALALTASAAASNTNHQQMMWGDEGGGGWYGLPCNAYYYGWVVTVNGQTAVCVNNGVYWEWYPL